MNWANVTPSEIAEVRQNEHSGTEDRHSNRMKKAADPWQAMDVEDLDETLAPQVGLCLRVECVGRPVAVLPVGTKARGAESHQPEATFVDVYARHRLQRIPSG